MEIKTIDIANTTESDLLAIIKNNCQVSKNIQSQIDTLSKFKMKPISEQRETKKMEKPQKLVETPMESREDQDLSRALSLVNMFKESVEIREDIVEQIAEFAEEQNMSPTDKLFKRTEDKFMNQSIKKDKVFKDLEVMQEYYKRLASNEKTKRQQTKKQLRNYQQFEELFTTAIQKSEIRNYEELVEKIANPTLRLEVLRFIYKHNLAFQQQLYSTYRAELNDATIPYKEFLSRNNLSLENIEALMTKSIEELEKMLKELSALNIQNKEQILEGSNLARISKLKELMKKGIITEEFLNKNSSLFQIEQPQYQTITANIEFLKEKNMTPPIDR